jgi:hypothetical protein
MGYYLYYEYRQTQARSHLRDLLDQHTSAFSEQKVKQKVASGQWVAFQIPITLYHQLDRDLEPTEGEFLYQDQVYEKAMRSIRNDTLYIYCVNNVQKDQVRQDLSDHVKTHIVDFTGNATEKSQKTVKLSFVQEYLSVERPALADRGFVLLNPSISTPYFSLTFRPLDVPFTPPRQA